MASASVIRKYASVCLVTRAELVHRICASVPLALSWPTSRHVKLCMYKRCVSFSPHHHLPKRNNNKNIHDIVNYLRFLFQSMPCSRKGSSMASCLLIPIPSYGNSPPLYCAPSPAPSFPWDLVLPPYRPQVPLEPRDGRAWLHHFDCHLANTHIHTACTRRGCVEENFCHWQTNRDQYPRRKFAQMWWI